jgi:hypothetical protein
LTFRKRKQISYREHRAFVASVQRMGSPASTKADTPIGRIIRHVRSRCRIQHCPSLSRSGPHGGLVHMLDRFQQSPRPSHYRGTSLDSLTSWSQLELTRLESELERLVCDCAEAFKVCAQVPTYEHRFAFFLEDYVPVAALCRAVSVSTEIRLRIVFFCLNAGNFTAPTLSLLSICLFCLLVAHFVV